jgi:glycosyltransferase involved in cell wall biosynthesis
LNFLLEDGWDVVVAARSSKNVERYGRLLRQRGVAVHPYEQSDLEQLLLEQPIDLAILAFWHIAEPIINSIRRLSPHTRIIVDSMDLHFLRHARRIFSSVPEGQLLDANYASETIRELNVYAAADLVLTVSEKEGDLVNDLTGDPHLGRVVPIWEDLSASAVGFEERCGILFIGNFEHPPNVDGLKYLCQEIVPRLDPVLLTEQPVLVVGNDLGPAIRDYGRGLTGIRMIGWVPSVMPYLERARVSVVPLRYGAGTKGKLIQALAIGTPTVSTTVGIEGLSLEHGEQVLVADDPQTFAESIATLLSDSQLWQRLAQAGRERMAALRGPEIGRGCLRAAIDAALQRAPKNTPFVSGTTAHQLASMPSEPYSHLLLEVRRAVEEHLPAETTVAVVSKGDANLLALGGRTSWHFPQDGNGQYAGFYPSDSAAAIDQVKAARSKGADFLVFPATALWWFEHYRELDEYLERRFRCLVWDEKACVIFDLRRPIDRSEPEVQPVTPRPDIRPLDRKLKCSDRPQMSVIVPTFNRASLLEPSLESLANQSLGPDAFEVIVVDDGSTDGTAAVCERFTSSLRLRHCPIARSGIAAAKNAGVLKSRAPLLLFFDDDDVADRELLSEHLQAHSDYPDENVAVLGYTTWAPWLDVTPVMHFVTDVGHYLFSYDGLADGQILDFTYFWGGRTSCKRSLLVKAGLFRPEFQFGSEDIELGYRLSKFGLKVIFQRDAVQHMNRAITYDEFCRRCERQGISQWMFSRMHDDPVVQRWCGVANAAEKWQSIENALSEKIGRTRDLERSVTLLNGTRPEGLVRELWRLYWWTFDGSKLKGIMDAMRSTV